VPHPAGAGRRPIAFFAERDCWPAAPHARLLAIPLRATRQPTGLNQTKFALRLGRSQTYESAAERGDYRIATLLIWVNSSFGDALDEPLDLFLTCPELIHTVGDPPSAHRWAVSRRDAQGGCMDDRTDACQGQILALSGGGYRGLYTAKILACIEEDIGHPVAQHFDLLAGTSIGGILALGLACELPAAMLVNLFEQHGSAIFKRRAKGLFKSKYSSDGLARLLRSEDVFGSRTLGDCQHPVLIPSISYTTGDPVMFKTAHHRDFRTDHRKSLVDVALATSAAPSYFPRHTFDNTQYVDGGLIVNAPGLIALHEMEHFLGVPAAEVRLMSIGTMSSKYTVNAGGNSDGGALDWGGGNPIGMPGRLFGLAISANETLTHYMLRQRLSEKRYMHIDDTLTDQSARSVDLDKTDDAARQILLGRAMQRSKVLLSDPQFKNMMTYTASQPVFFHGAAANHQETDHA